MVAMGGSAGVAVQFDEPVDHLADYIEQAASFAARVGYYR